MFPDGVLWTMFFPVQPPEKQLGRVVQSPIKLTQS